MILPIFSVVLVLEKTALNFPAEASGSVKNPNGEKDTTRRATLSYGYGQSVTLAQVAQAYAGLANYGQMHPLRLVKSEESAEPTKVIEARHAEAIVKMMELVTEQGGTARAAAINGYRVAGKTGTSRRAKPEGVIIPISIAQPLQALPLRQIHALWWLFW